MTIDRRAFLAMAGAAALPLPAAATETGGPMLIVNALGGLVDPNPPAGADGGQAISARILADARASGLHAVNQTIGYVAGDGDPFEQTIRDIATWTARFRNQPADLLHVTAASDIFRARREGRIGVLLGFQNAAMIGEDPSRIDIFANLGVRVIQLTYNPANALGDGSMAPQNSRSDAPWRAGDRKPQRQSRDGRSLAFGRAHLPRRRAAVAPADLDQPHRLPRPGRSAPQQDRRRASGGGEPRRLRRHLFHALSQPQKRRHRRRRRRPYRPCGERLRRGSCRDRRRRAAPPASTTWPPIAPACTPRSPQRRAMASAPPARIPIPCPSSRS